LTARRARVRNVDIAGVSVWVDLQGGDILPLLRQARAKGAPPAPAPPPPASGAAPTPAPSPAPEPAATPESAQPTAAPEPAHTASAPWHWTVDDLHLSRSKVWLEQENAPLEIGLDVGLRGLSDEGHPGHLDAKITVAPGSLAVAGAVR